MYYPSPANQIWNSGEAMLLFLGRITKLCGAVNRNWQQSQVFYESPHANRPCCPACASVCACAPIAVQRKCRQLILKPACGPAPKYQVYNLREVQNSTSSPSKIASRRLLLSFSLRQGTVKRNVSNILYKFNNRYSYVINNWKLNIVLLASITYNTYGPQNNRILPEFPCFNDEPVCLSVFKARE
jgi:hypothetical protein